MNYGEFKRNVLMEIGEYSANGSKISDLANKDYTLAMVDATNQTLRYVASIGKTNDKEQDIAQYNPKNQLSTQFLTYYHEDEEVEFMAIGSQGYSFYLGKNGQFVIEEEITGVWTELTSATNIAEGYTLYKGNLTLTSTDNNVRIRFIGDYFYPIRWVALFKSKLSDSVEYSPKSVYDLNDDFYKLTKVAIFKEDKYSPYGDYQYDEANEQMLFDYDIKGEFKVYYSAHPTELVFDENDVNSNDAVELDIPNEYLNPAILEVAGKLKANIDKKYGVGDRYQAISIDQFNAVESADNKFNGPDTIIDTTKEW